MHIGPVVLDLTVQVDELNLKFISLIPKLFAKSVGPLFKEALIGFEQFGVLPFDSLQDPVFSREGLI